MQPLTETPPPAPLEETVDLFDLAVRFLMEWRRMLLVMFVIFAICLAFVYSIRPLYEATATILPQSQQEASSLTSLFSSHTTGDVFIGLLSSRSVQDDVINRAGLMDVYKARSREKARGALAGSSTFSVGSRDTLVTVKVRASDADVAQRIANAYLDALQAQREQMLSREAELHDRFYQEQMRIQADALAVAEQDLKQTQEKTGVVQPDAQTNIGLNAIAGVQVQITNLQVQLAAVRLGATDQNPRVQDLESQIAALQGKEHALESAAPGSTPGSAASAKAMPQLNMDYARKLREVKYHETLLTSISNRYESSRLSEGYSDAPFVVVDRAIAPETKAWPPRRQMVMLAAAFSLIMGAISVAMTLLYRRLMSDPLQVERMQQLRACFRPRP